MVLKAVITQLMFLPCIVWLVWSLESWIAFSAMHQPFIIFSAISIGMISLPFLFVRKPAALAVPCVLTIFLIVLPFTITSSLKPLRWGMAKLEPGIDRETVLRTLNASYSGTHYKTPRVSGAEEECRTVDGQLMTRILLKPQDRPAYLNAESLIVFFIDGSFSHSNFVPD